MTKIMRTERDGLLTVSRDRQRHDIHLAVEDGGCTQGIWMSEWQARRALAALSQLLELPLSKKAQKEIEL